MDKFKERIPIIIERSSTEQKLPDLEQQKYTLSNLFNTFF